MDDSARDKETRQVLSRNIGDIYLYFIKYVDYQTIFRYNLTTL
jgi:hypothetical protein